MTMCEDQVSAVDGEAPRALAEIGQPGRRVAGVEQDARTELYHELRSPLALISTAARAAADDCGPATTARSRCETIARVADRMLRAATEVLDRERERARTGVRSEEFFAPATLLDGLVRDLRSFDVPARWRCGRDARSALVHGSRVHFEMLLQTLVGNAVAHRRHASTIRLALTRVGDSLEFSIANRAAGAEDEHEGAGLGATLARQYAQRLNAPLLLTQEARRYYARIRLPIAAIPQDELLRDAG